MKFLFVGCGSIGRRHIKNLKQLTDCEILAYRVRKESLGDFEKEHAIKTYDDLDAALNEKPDAVFITNPTSLHLSTAQKAAEQGCHLFIEKPLSHTIENVDEFIQLCSDKKLIVMLGPKRPAPPVTMATLFFSENFSSVSILFSYSFYLVLLFNLESNFKYSL